MASNRFDPARDGKSKKAEPEDPLTLAGMVLPLSPDEEREAADKMAETFVEEYALMGCDEEALFELFRNPFYRFSHEVYKTRGEAYVRGLIRKVRGTDPTPEERSHV